MISYRLACRLRIRQLERFEDHGQLTASEARELFWLRYGPDLAQIMALFLFACICLSAVWFAYPQ